MDEPFTGPIASSATIATAARFTAGCALAVPPRVKNGTRNPVADMVGIIAGEAITAGATRESAMVDHAAERAIAAGDTGGNPRLR